MNVPNGSESFKRRNPHLFGPMGAVEARKPKPATPQALDSGPPKLQESSRILVVFTACVRRKLDSDNLQGAIKPLRDSVAQSLGIDDGDERIEFEYGQQLTRGEEGVVVKIHR